MRRQTLATTAWAIALLAGLSCDSSRAAGLIWEVESPFRLFKSTRAFALQ